MKKKRARNDEVADSLNGASWLLSKEEVDNREFKVRIVERLTYLERRLNKKGEG